MGLYLASHQACVQFDSSAGGSLKEDKGAQDDLAYVGSWEQSKGKGKGGQGPYFGVKAGKPLPYYAKEDFKAF
jgi:hypothetical protein